MCFSWSQESSKSCKEKCGSDPVIIPCGAFLTSTEDTDVSVCIATHLFYCTIILTKFSLNELLSFYLQ